MLARTEQPGNERPNAIGAVVAFGGAIVQQAKISDMIWTKCWLAFAILLVCASCAPGLEASLEPTEILPPGSAQATPTEIAWFPPTETPPAYQAATQEPTPERKPGLGEVLIVDAMTSATHWNASSAGPAPVTVSAQGLTLSAEPGKPAVVSLHRSAVLDDLYIELTARPSLCKGEDAYGVAIRSLSEVTYYRFAAVCDGTAAAERVSRGAARALQPPIATADVPTGAPGEVRLGVWALGPEMRFFLNGRYQFTATDSSYRAGAIGVFAQAGGGTPVVVTFSDMEVRRLIPPTLTPRPSS